MAQGSQWLRARATLAEDLGLGPSAFIRQLTAACNSTPEALVASPLLYAPTLIGPYILSTHNLKNLENGVAKKC